MRTRATLLLLAVTTPLACGDDRPAPLPLLDAGADVAVDAPAKDAGVDVPSVTDAPVSAGAARVVVEHYDYDLDVAARRGRARLRLRVTAAGDCVTLPFRPAAADDVTLDDAPARDVVVGGGRLVACDPTGQGYAVGSTVTLGTSSSLAGTATLRNTQVGFSSRTDSAGGTFTYLLSWVGQCDRFGACDNDPGVFATYHFNVTHTAQQRVFCPGTVTATATRTECDFRFAGGPTYSTFGVMIGQRWIDHSLGRAANVDLTLFDLVDTGITAALDAGRVQGMVAFMSERFGPYPYGNTLRFVVAPTTWAGFEHPGNIALAQTLARGNAEHTVFHEIAHQWAGDQTTLASVRDFVWKEAMAEYLSFVYESTRMGEARGIATARIWKDAARTLANHPVPRADVPINEFYGAAYGPGPMVLFRQLEVRYSRDAVMGALGDLLGRPRAISLDDVRRALEARTSANLAAYFNGWLVGDGAPTWPTARVVRNTEADGAVTVTVNPNGTGRGMMFVVRVEGAAGERLDVPVDLGIDGAGTSTVTARPGFVVTRVTVDPDAQALVYEASGAEGAFASQGPAVQPWLAP